MGNKKILIVDDDADFLEATKLVLQSKYDVAVASSGDECLNRLKEGKPDLVVLDVMMVGTDEGFEVSRQIKNNPDTSHIPVIMLTGIAAETGLDFKREAGNKRWLPVDDYIEKPVAPAVLLGRIEKLLSRSQQI